MRRGRMSRAGAASVGGLVGLAMLVSGCQSLQAGQDKAGGDAVVIRLATADDVNNNGQSFGPQAFVDALTEVSGGQITVEVDMTTFTNGTAEDEAAIIQAIADGEFDGGWPSTRAFAAAGIEGLEVVEAPLTITSYAAQKQLVTSPVADELLGRLDGTGVVGLALAVGPVRRPFTVDAPVLHPDDWDGLRIRSYNSPVQDATIRALGAEPVHVGYTWPGLVSSGELDGLEFDIAQYAANGAVHAQNVATNIVLWPKVFVLAVSEQFYESLSPQQQQWVRDAAQQARQASVDAEYDEDTPAAGMCERGVVFATATADERDALREAVQPVLDDLAADPLLEQMQDIAADHPDPQTLTVPGTCASTLPVRIEDPGPIPTTPSGLPDGTYRVEITEDDLAASGVGEPGEGSSGIYTLTVSDGMYQVDCTPVSPPGGIDCWYAQELPAGFDSNPRVIGPVTGDDTTAYFVHDPALEEELTDCDPTEQSTPASCAPPYREKVTWRLEGDQLGFTDLVSADPGYPWVLKPWTKIN